MHYYSDLYPLVITFIHCREKKNPLNWQDWYHFDWREVKNLSKYIEPYIGPYLKNYSINGR